MKNGLLFIAVLFVAACVPDKKADAPEIVETVVAGQKLCIPREYIKIPNDPNDSTVPIQTMYPDFLPLEKRPNEYWKEGEWWRHVDILIMPKSQFKSFDEIVANKIEFYGATLVQGLEHGLEKRAKPDNTTGARLDRGDLWFEKNGADVVSIVQCTKKHNKKTNPQCQNHFLIDSSFISVFYDKKLLPHWKEIKTKSIALIDSFDCKSRTQRESNDH